jgi:t-SNARE complex subunit (syntaxin)
MMKTICMIIKGGVTMKKDNFQNTIFDEDGDAIVRQQLLDSYYEGTTDTKKNDENERQDIH